MSRALINRIILQSVLLLFVLTLGSQIIFSQDRARALRQNRSDHNYCESVYYSPFKRSCLKKIRGQLEKYCQDFQGTPEEIKCAAEIQQFDSKLKETSPLPIKMFLTFSVIILLGLWYSSLVRLPKLTRGIFNTMILREIESSPPTILVIKTIVVIISLFVYTQLLKSFLWS